jgi:hypothetical protein
MTRTGGIFPSASFLFVLIDQFAEEDETADDDHDENNSDQLRDHDDELGDWTTMVSGD